MPIQRAARAKESGQHGLFFGGAAAEPKVHFELRDAPPWSEEERLTSEYAMLGFYVSATRSKIRLAPQGLGRTLARRA